MFVPFGKQPGPAALAVPFVLPAQSEDWDRPRGSQPVPAPPGSPPACAAGSRLRILCPSGSSAMREGEAPAASRSSGPVPAPHPPGSCPGRRILLSNSLRGVFVSIPLFCSPFQIPDFQIWGGIRGEEQGSTCSRRPRSRLLQMPNPLRNGMLRSTGFGRSSPLSASQ